MTKVSGERSVTVLGCDGSYPGPGGAGSSYLVQAGGLTVLLDAGPGSFSNLQLISDPARVDMVMLTHRHPDHWTDLESMAVWAAYGPGQTGSDGTARQPLPVFAPAGLRPRSSFADGSMLTWHEVRDDTTVDLGAVVGQKKAQESVTARFSATDHGPPTLAVRFDCGGHSFVYSADTGPAWVPGSFLEGVDLLLCEATYLADQEGTLQHLSGRQAGALGASAEVSRLVVTHRWPTVSPEALKHEATAAFGGPVAQAAVGDVLAW